MKVGGRAPDIHDRLTLTLTHCDLSKPTSDYSQKGYRPVKAKHHRIESDPSPDIGVEPLTDCAEVSEHVEVRASTGADTPLARRGRPRTNGRQALILAFIRDFVSRNPYPPTVREIAKGLSDQQYLGGGLQPLRARGRGPSDPNPPCLPRHSAGRPRPARYQGAPSFLREPRKPPRIRRDGPCDRGPALPPKPDVEGLNHSVVCRLACPR